MYPTLKVKLNKELDKKVCLQFINFQKSGIDFGKGIITIHSDLGEAKRLLGSQRKRHFHLVSVVIRDVVVARETTTFKLW